MGTEDNNIRTRDIDKMDTLKIVETIHLEDIRAYEAVGCAKESIAKVIDSIYERVTAGGRVFYIGAGTSGRIAAQDVAELEPTYGIMYIFYYIMAGGNEALAKSKEGAEDDREKAIEELKGYELNEKDVVIGITASGRTPFVVAAIEYGKSVGAYTVSITNNRNSVVSKISDYSIVLDTGEEVIQGSTRMKAGTAQKMTLNNISTTLAIKLGKTDGNVMTHMKAFYNEKLKNRAVKILIDKFGIDEEKVRKILEMVNYNIPEALNLLKRSNSKPSVD
jgi:N-acetylmuramic acid 6-phosphate etherase